MGRGGRAGVRWMIYLVEFEWEVVDQCGRDGIEVVFLILFSLLFAADGAEV